MKKTTIGKNGRGELISGYHVRPYISYGPYARARDAAVLATSLQWNREMQSAAAAAAAAAVAGARQPCNSDIPGINKTLSPDNPIIRTIGQHYYPEGGWGWIISVCSSLCYFITAALFPAHSFLILDIVRTFKPDEGILAAVLIGAFSTMVTLLFSPVIISLCRRKSTRLTAVVGGLVTALGCLFTSFATQFHQLLISYGIFIGIGVSMLRDTSVIMIGQYFKKKREFVEIFLLTGNGLGMALMPIFLSFCIRSQSWRTGFQSLALVAFINFFIGVLYRPASLYHPQRRAILHLKSLQKKSRLKEYHHSKQSTPQMMTSNNNIYGTPTNGPNKPAYFDFSILKSRTIRILLSGTCISSFGIWAPIFLLAYHGEKAGITYSALLGLQTFLGLGVVLGTVAFGLIVVKNSVDCMIARQYLCQASSLMIAASLLAFSALDDYSGYLLFVWIYGFFLGGYTYSLKMYIYEKVRARNFNRAWSFLQSVQSIPIMVGVPITGFISEYYGNKSGFFLSSFCTALGALILFLIDGHKRNYDDKPKMSLSAERTYGLTDGAYEAGPGPLASPTDGRVFIDPLIFTGQPLVPSSNETLAQVNFTHLKTLSAHHHHQNQIQSHHPHPGIMSPTHGDGGAGGASVGNYDLLSSNLRSNSLFSASFTGPSLPGTLPNQSNKAQNASAAAVAAAAAAAVANGELTCISEEVFMENFMDDYCPGDCITSCSRDEKYVMLSELENNIENGQLPENTAALLKLRRAELAKKEAGESGHHHHHHCQSGGLLSDHETQDIRLACFRGNAVRRRASFPIIPSNGAQIDFNLMDGASICGGGISGLSTAENGLMNGLFTNLIFDRKVSTASTGDSGVGCTGGSSSGNGGRTGSSGCLGVDGESDDSDSNGNQLVNQCSGCLRFVQPNHGSEQNKNETEVNSPLITLEQQQQQQTHQEHQSSIAITTTTAATSTAVNLEKSDKPVTSQITEPSSTKLGPMTGTTTTTTPVTSEINDVECISPTNSNVDSVKE